MENESNLKFSSGIPALDGILQAILPGDNVVFQIDELEDYIPFVKAFSEYCNEENLDLVYFRFADHEELLPPGIKASVYILYPEKRFEYFADQFYKHAKFCKFHWPINADPKLYRLKMLPTTVLFKDGHEIDRIKGIPPDKRARLKWNRDIELWLLKNVLGLEGDRYAGKFKYFFKNSYKLHISNY